MAPDDAPSPARHTTECPAKRYGRNPRTHANNPNTHTQLWRDHWKQWAPLSHARLRDHWKQWAPLSHARLRGTPLSVAPGGAVSVAIGHDDTNVSVGLASVTAAATAAAAAPASAAAAAAEEGGGGGIGGGVGHAARPPAPLTSWNSPLRMWQLQAVGSHWAPLAC
jgi:hypothetical protein